MKAHVFDEFTDLTVQHRETPVGEYTGTATASGSETAGTSAFSRSTRRTPAEPAT